jgi:hypothetical protein
MSCSVLHRLVMLGVYRHGVDSGIEPITVCIRRAKRNIDDSFDLLRRFFRKISDALGPIRSRVCGESAAMRAPRMLALNEHLSSEQQDVAEAI